MRTMTMLVLAATVTTTAVPAAAYYWTASRSDDPLGGTLRIRFRADPSTVQPDERWFALLRRFQGERLQGDLQRRARRPQGLRGLVPQLGDAAKSRTQWTV